MIQSWCFFFYRSWERNLLMYRPTMLCCNLKEKKASLGFLWSFKCHLLSSHLSLSLSECVLLGIGCGLRWKKLCYFVHEHLKIPIRAWSMLCKLNTLQRASCHSYTSCCLTSRFDISLMLPRHLPFCFSLGKSGPWSMAEIIPNCTWNVFDW